MQKITMFMMAACPYCKEALRLMDGLYAEDAKYKALDIELIDERLNPEVADQFDYHYVPTYYVGGVKLHEGAADIGAIRRVFDAAMA
jgi:glutaredoxin